MNLRRSYLGLPLAALLAGGTTVEAQPSSVVQAVVEALRPVLKYPTASADGELPVDHSATAKWFVVWPADPDDTQVLVKANPLHPETQRASAAAMEQINAAVIVAERKAQAAYDRALDQLRRGGNGSDIDGISLDDEGIAGERIDAELELRIEIDAVQSFTIDSSVTPVVAAGSRGATWSVSVPANSYRSTKPTDPREHFRAAELRLYFGEVARPDVTRQSDDPHFAVAIGPSPRAIALVLRGNEALLNEVAVATDWSGVAAAIR